jgi:hypothetical protein
MPLSIFLMRSLSKDTIHNCAGIRKSLRIYVSTGGEARERERERERERDAGPDSSWGGPGAEIRLLISKHRETKGGRVHRRVRASPQPSIFSLRPSRSLRLLTSSLILLSAYAYRACGAILIRATARGG